MTAVAQRPRRPRTSAPARIARPGPRRLVVAGAAAIAATMAAAGCAQVDGLAGAFSEAVAPSADRAEADPAPAPAPAPALTPAELAASGRGLAHGPLRGGAEAARGSALLAAGHAEAAERAFSVSLATEGPSAQALVGLGAANRALGRQRAARDVLERAAVLWPGDVAARNALGAVLYDDEEFAAARAQFAVALSLIPPGDEAARQEVIRNIAFTDAALERRRVAQDARDAQAEPASGPVVRPLGGGRWRIDPPKGT